MRFVFGIISILTGIYVIALWGVGSHGHFRFRAHMTEDWILLFLTVVPILGGILIMVYPWLKRKKQ